MNTFRFKVGPKKVGIGGRKLRYVARPYYAVKLNEDTVVRQIAELNMGVSKGVVYSVLEAIISEFKQFLFLGHPVKLAGLGTFRLSFDSESKDSPEGFTAADIKNLRILFRPDVELKKEMYAKVKFEEMK